MESAGKDPGRYPPRGRPTRESLGSFYNVDEMTEEEIEERVQLSVRAWEDDVGRLYRENKGHWLTMPPGTRLRYAGKYRGLSAKQDHCECRRPSLGNRFRAPVSSAGNSRLAVFAVFDPR